MSRECHIFDQKSIRLTLSTYILPISTLWCCVIESDTAFSNRKKFATVSKMPPKGVYEDFRFSLSPEDLTKKVEEFIKECRRIYDDIVAVPDENVSYDTILKVLNEAERTYKLKRLYAAVCGKVSTNKALRDASMESQKKMSAFEVEKSMRKDLFKKLIILENQKETFKPEGKRYLEKLILQGKRNGLHLDENTLNCIRNLSTKISDLKVECKKNMGEESSTYEFTGDDLYGVPDDFLSNLKKNETGKYIVTLKYPDYFPIMEKCRRPETRKKMHIAFYSRCKEENGPLLKEIVKLRHELASLLGYPSHAAYVHEILMAKTPETVAKFLTDLSHKLKPLWEDEKKWMLELKEKECKELGISFDDQIHSYDTPFYQNKITEIKYAVNQDVLKEYFPLPVVTQGLLCIYQELLGLKFEEVKDAEVWNEEVEMFSVSDSNTGDLLGYFFLDMFPREGKYSHAANMCLQTPCLLPDGTRQLALAAIVANFTKPQKDKPSLLTLNEVKTYFHEFGHTMHLICGQNELTFFNPFSVESDFVEAPSQMLENWCWEREPLKRMSFHFSNQSEIPEQLLKDLINSRNANAGLRYLYQIVLALSDLKIHSSTQSDIPKVFHDTHKEIIGIEPQKGTDYSSNFPHLVGGYDAQYYVYLWSEVFSKDMFYSRFKDGKIMDKEVGQQYREKILKPGGAKDAMELLEDFLGRKPTNDAFLHSLGLKV